jgi:hypothetical protein
MLPVIGIRLFSRCMWGVFFHAHCVIGYILPGVTLAGLARVDSSLTHQGVSQLFPHSGCSIPRQP